MDIANIISLGSLSWSSITKLFVMLFIVVTLAGGLSYFYKKYATLLKEHIDIETFNQILGKIMSFVVKAEYDQPLAGKGEDKMKIVQKLAMEHLTPKELNIVQKKGGISKIVENLLPIVTNILPMLFLRNKK